MSQQRQKTGLWKLWKTRPRTSSFPQLPQPLRLDIDQNKRHENLNKNVIADGNERWSRPPRRPSGDAPSAPARE